MNNKILNDYKRSSINIDLGLELMRCRNLRQLVKNEFANQNKDF